MIGFKGLSLCNCEDTGTDDRKMVRFESIEGDIRIKCLGFENTTGAGVEANGNKLEEIR